MLLRDLEFAGIKNFAVMVPQLVDINSAAIFVEIDRSFCRNIFLFEHHLPKEVKDLHVVTLIRIFLKVERDK